MAVLYITEFSSLGATPNGVAATPQQPPIAEQTLVIGGSSLTSSPFQPATRFVRLCCDVACSIKFGTGTPVASATTCRMAQNQIEYHGVPQGAGFAVSVITNS